MINYFTPVKILGKGAFCTVISAHDKLSDSQVAIKILSKSGFKKSQVDMLRKESIILNRLNHPNIVRMKMVSIVVKVVKRNYWQNLFSNGGNQREFS